MILYCGAGVSRAARLTAKGWPNLMDDPTLTQHLERLRYDDVRVPIGWRIAAHYEKLVEAGLAVEVSSESEAVRQFSITAAGRAVLVGH